jgi:phenylacetic acid degradation operon negative regulatory protein
MAPQRTKHPQLQRPRSGRSGKALLLTVLGEFALPNDGTIWTSTVVQALGLLQIGEANARQAAARLGEEEVIAASRRGRATQWKLAPRGVRLLTGGAQRIYHFGDDQHDWDNKWLLALTQIPEDQRLKRHYVRAQLGFAGFGFLNAGTAISPHTDRLGEAEAILSSLALDPAPVIFVAEATALAPNHELINRAWDLEELALKYRTFLETFTRLQPHQDNAYFAALVNLVHEWRRFPFEDPEIPEELLPTNWPGKQAKELFDDRRRAWSSGAQQWFAEREATG